MTMLSKFKKTRKQQTAKLVEGFEESKGSTKSYKDENEWQPTFDEDKGTGFAVVRFLPYDPDELPTVRLFRHSFQGPTGKWYIENCLSTLGKDDPVNEMNRRLWNSGIESDKEVARDCKRKMSYYSNVLVIKDPANRENEGKIFKYRFGKKIFDKIQSQAQPEFEDMDAFNIFDLWEGKNFTIRMKKVKKFINYDESSFADSVSPVDEDDEKIDEILSKTFNLQDEYMSGDNFKTYDALRARLFEVMGPYAGSGVVTVEGWEGEEEKAEKPAKSNKASKPAKSSKTDEDESSDSGTSAVDNADQDDDLDDLLGDLLD